MIFEGRTRRPFFLDTGVAPAPFSTAESDKKNQVSESHDLVFLPQTTNSRFRLQSLESIIH
ncbi:hypothetical protein CHH74_18070 [Shouchella clausii]|uniref:Uncharacterized protein n=1 Tax=Shouchella clausii TaxID=79880 RepID=A0A268S696_SHOCL|nr:hypothetical protein CHH74_18070 [Shouchella clausii]PAE98196.1 hypothetical protein CHH71_05615 [Shouchella clausii]PAF28010.1 hypothetical protein CHH61_00560 [Shouchella clausii]